MRGQSGSASRRSAAAWRRGRRLRRRAAGLASLLLAGLLLEPASPFATTSAAQELPEGVTPEVVEEGRSLFHGRAACTTCHGAEGEGLPGLGSDLSDDVWLHGDGSLGSLVDRIRLGVSAEASRMGIPMPPRGGVRLTDEELRALAAYVWTLGRRDEG